MKVLGIETSCDETAVCLIEASGEFGADFKFEILGNGLTSQASLHAQYGGVFPNLAKREHAKNLVPMLEKTFHQAGTSSHAEGLAFPKEAVKNILTREPELWEQLEKFLHTNSKPDIDCIAVTYGPGLEPALWVGINFAKALSRAWDVPIVAVNHMEGHIALSMMEKGNLAAFEFPALALLISGGHTELVLAEKFGTYRLVGETRDDAAGEAFDKVARLLQLPYPGGPEISKLARQARLASLPRVFELPRPMLNEDNFDFSFSGLKTAVRRIVEAGALDGEKKSQLAQEFEDAVADVLVTKTMRALDAYGANTIVVGGGVSANEHIRHRLAETLAEAGNSAQLLIPPPELATDNAIMIALAGYFHALKNEFAEPENLKATGNLTLA